jgi:hypothetical protein
MSGALETRFQSSVVATRALRKPLALETRYGVFAGVLAPTSFLNFGWSLCE